MLGTRFTMVEPFARKPYEDAGVIVPRHHAAMARRVDRIIYEELVAGSVVAQSSQRKLRTLITSFSGRRSRRSCWLYRTGAGGRCRANVLPVYDTTRNPLRRRGRGMLGDEESARAAA